jgi:hypothetical protein
MTPDDLRQRLFAVFSNEFIDLIVEDGSHAYHRGPKGHGYTRALIVEAIVDALAAPAPVRTCAGCRHWDRYDGDEPEPENQHNECRAANRPADYMLTGADFGCSLWQPTPQEEA